MPVASIDPKMPHSGRCFEVLKFITRERGIMKYLFVAALMALLTEPAFADREDRINAAIPLSAPAQTALELLHRVATDHSQLAVLEDQFHTKLRLRALQCGQNYTLAESASTEDIRREHGGDPCFAEFDEDLAEWLGLHSIGFMLALPPLRPMSGSTQQSISDSTGPIRTVHFAARAGVAIIDSLKDTEVVDLQSGSPIFSSVRQAEDQITSLSPNGRIYTAANRAAVRFYDAATGAFITAPRWCSIVGRCGFYWLDERSAMMYSADTQRSMIFDFRTGTQTPLDTGFEGVARLVRLGASSEFFALSNSSIVHFRLTYVNDQPRVEFIKINPTKLNLLWNEEGGLNANGRVFSALSDGKIYLISTDNLTVDVIDLGSFFVQEVVPTTDPDKLLASGYVMGGPNTTQSYLISMSGRTLSELDTTRIRARRFFYHQGRNALFSLTESSLELAQKLPTQAAVGVANFVARQNNPVSAPPPSGFLAPTVPQVMAYGRPKPAEPVPGVIADLAKDAEIQGIGVYEADDPQANGGKPPGTFIGTLPGSAVSVYQLSPGQPAAAPPVTAGIIKVTVRSGKRPLVLVLSSFAAVDWQLTVEPGTQLKAVLISGTHGSTVSGQGSARVAAVGNAYSYSLGSPEYTLLQNEIYTWTGRRIELFQCGYKASNFTVAGI
jgi:hypothetical protein